MHGDYELEEVESKALFPAGVADVIYPENITGKSSLNAVLPSELIGKTDAEDEIFLNPGQLVLNRPVFTRYAWMTVTIVGTVGINGIRLLKKIFSVQQNQIAITRKAGVYEFIGEPGLYTMNGLQHHHVRTVDLGVDADLIDLVTKKILRVPQGHLGVVTDRNGQLFLYQPGRYVLGTANHKHYGNVNAAVNDIEIKVAGNLVARVLRISDRRAYVVNRAGTTQILRTGYHWLGADSEVLGSFSLQQKTDTLTLVLPNKDGQLVRVTVEIFYQILDPQHAVQLGFKDEEIKQRLEAITSTMVSSAIAAHTTEEIVLARHLIDTSTNISSSSSTYMNSNSCSDTKAGIVVDLSLPDEIKRKLGAEYIRQLAELGVGNVRIATITPQIADDNVRQKWQNMGLQRAQTQNDQRNNDISNVTALASRRAEGEQQKVAIELEIHRQVQLAQSELNAATIRAQAKQIEAQADAEAAKTIDSVPLAADLARIRAMNGALGCVNSLALGPNFSFAQAIGALGLLPASSEERRISSATVSDNPAPSR